MISAFVGHSFNDEDEKVVRKFTDYFDTLSSSPEGFRWESAKAAEPKVLAQKVKEKMTDKDIHKKRKTNEENTEKNISENPDDAYIDSIFEAVFEKNETKIKEISEYYDKLNNKSFEEKINFKAKILHLRFLINKDEILD